jgi:hypothetical protein
MFGFLFFVISVVHFNQQYNSMKHFYKPGTPFENPKTKGSEHKKGVLDDPDVPLSRDDEEAVSSFVQETPSDEEPYNLEELLERIRKNPTPREADYLFGEPLGEQSDAPIVHPREKND